MKQKKKGEGGADGHDMSTRIAKNKEEPDDKVDASLVRKKIWSYWKGKILFYYYY